MILIEILNIKCQKVKSDKKTRPHSDFSHAYTRNMTHRAIVCFSLYSEYQT